MRYARVQVSLGGDFEAQQSAAPHRGHVGVLLKLKGRVVAARGARKR